MRLIIKPVFIFFYSILLLGCDANFPSNKEIKEEPGMFEKSKTENYVIFSPMEGVLLKNGKPLPNTKIIRRLKWNGNEDGLVEEFSTDELGRFSLPVHEEELALGMLSQFVGRADIEFETDNGKDYLWSSSKFFPEIYTETNGKIVNLVCDIMAEEFAVPMGPTSILTKCRWQNMPE